MEEEVVTQEEESTTETEEQKIQEMRLELLGDINDDSCDDIFTLKLKQAKYIALETLYPFDKEITELPQRVNDSWQVRCAIELYNQQGTEGYSQYSENGLSWSKAGGGLISKELMEELVPKADVPR